MSLQPRALAVSAERTLLIAEAQLRRARDPHKLNTKMAVGTLQDVKLGFYGGGMMAEAIVKGLLSKQVISTANICVCELVPERRDMFEELDVSVTAEGEAMLDQCEVVILAVKPDVVPDVLRLVTDQEKNEGPSEDRLLISICAGVKIKALQYGNSKRRCARVMPNQPCLVGEAASGFTMSDGCTDRHREIVKELMGSCGFVCEVPEKHMDAVTGLSGSGPAYVYMMIEAMSDAGVRQGLPRATARQLAAQTVFGAAKMALQSPETHLGELRNRVESPGGTTIAATATLEDNGFRWAVIDAVAEATERSRELGESDEDD